MLKIADIKESQIMFYDIETTHQYAAYCDLKMIGVKYGFRGEVELVETPEEQQRFREGLADPDMLKVSFNGMNFDNLVLYRYGYPVNPKGMHDCFLMLKTVQPGLPAYSLKFANWFYFGDPHLPEMELEGWAKRNKRDKWTAPKEILGPYCKWDIDPQTVKMFCLLWEVVQRPTHWQAYSEVELGMAMPLEEMMLRAGEYLDSELIGKKLKDCEREKEVWNLKANVTSQGAVVNANSVKQVGDFLDLEGLALGLTDAGNWSIPKKELLDLRSKHPVAEAMFQVRRLNNAMAYYRNYLEALRHCEDHRVRGWIPKQYSSSRARTRRILSDSFYGINFQNGSKEAKAVQVVPKGWLGFWIDATQIENVVHIYESRDHERRKAYEADPDWSEYVWLCNKILGNTLSKKELDDRTKYPAPSNPTWSVYKLYKTIKLALNFAMGLDKFCNHTGVDRINGRAAFDTVHRACPAIKGLQKKLIQRFLTEGFVQDVFGHIYTCNPNKAYKIVAYLIQGCGTGSLPKACIAALYDVVHECDVTIQAATDNNVRNFLPDFPRQRACLGVLSSTIHDEIGGRLSLDLGRDELVATLRRCMFVMTEMFSPLFDNIPLRGKLYLSRTTAGDAEEVNLDDPTTFEHYLV